jgi:hypothetical protein
MPATTCAFPFSIRQLKSSPMLARVRNVNRAAAGVSR